MVGYKDTEKLVPVEATPTGRNRQFLYNSSSRCCKTKASILVSKGACLVVGVVIVAVGAVLAGTIRHPLDEDECSNSTLACEEMGCNVSISSFAFPDLPSSYDADTTPTSLTTPPTPLSTSSHLKKSTVAFVVTPTPAPVGGASLNGATSTRGVAHAPSPVLTTGFPNTTISPTPTPSLVT